MKPAILDEFDSKSSLLRIHNLLDNSQIGSWLVDVKNNKLIWSEATKRIHGAHSDFEPNLEEAINFYPEGFNRDTITKLFQKAIEKNESYDVELQIQTIEGKLIWVRAIGAPEVEDGECVRVRGLFIDIDRSRNLLIESQLKERQFRLTFENAPIGMAIIGLDGSWLDMNKKVCEIVGYSEEELSKLTFQDITHPNDLDADVELVNDLIEGKDDKYYLDKRYIHKDGSLVWIELGVSIVRNENNQPLYFISQIRDITKEKNALDALKINERRLNVIFDSTYQIIGLLDVFGNIQNVNKTTLKYTKQSLFQLIGRQIWEVDIWNFKNVEPITLQQMVEDGLKGEFARKELELSNDGVITKIDFNINPVVDEDGQVTSLIFEGRPIQEIVEARNELENTLNQLQGVLDASSNSAIIGMDKNGLITTFNTGAENLLGYKADEIINRESYLLFNLPNEIKKRADEIVENSGEVTHGLETVFYDAKRNVIDSERKKYLKKNGEVLNVIATLTSIKNSRGEITGYLEVASNIDTIVKAEREINSLLDVTRDQNDRLLNFAHIVSHNLRSHISNQSMIIEIAKVENQEIVNSHHFQLLEKSISGLRETIQHLSEIVSVNTETKDKIKPVILNDFIDKAIEELQSLFNQTESHVNFTSEAEYQVMAVPAYLDSILNNLITNAIKYRSEKRKLNLNIELSRQNGFVEMKVQDNGQGIDLGRHGDKIFGMYKTFHAHPEARGIGLFISKNQVEAMGGTIEVSSTPDIGTTFLVNLRHEKN